MSDDILILYYSKNGGTRKMAHLIARGVESVNGVSARIRTVPQVTTEKDAAIPNNQNIDLYVSNKDLEECIGIALGSPSYFGNMASSLKYFFDNSTHEWLCGALDGKPATVFSSTGSLHGGQETCLWSMLIPLMHHGMIIVGLPYTNSNLMNTQTGGTPYGATHYAGITDELAISREEKDLAILQGKRLAETAIKLKKVKN